MQTLDMFSIDPPTIMKGFGYLSRRTLDDATENASAPADFPRASVKRVGTVLLVGAILACIHREISGASDGSLFSALTAYASDTLHHLMSILFSRGP
ncbi:hypothetical protein [Paraburkholderia phytofirmans]|uniref:hypothetical protein n=1 Tax=Paraburkholderia phytofirmans TaxID=261302 RepID=UPI0038BE1D03